MNRQQRSIVSGAMAVLDADRAVSAAFSISERAVKVSSNLELLLESFRATRKLLEVQNRRLLREISREHALRLELTNELRSLRLQRVRKLNREKRRAVSPKMADRLKLAEAL